MIELFITVIYQPFLNVLVLFYWILGFFTDGKPDMGIAVILLTIFIRLILLPLSIAGDRSEKERREITARVAEIEKVFESDPIRRDAEKRNVLQTNRRVLFAELFNLAIQVSIALMLWKIFASGLGGDDIHLIYSFMPKVELPFNLTFLGSYDLTHTSFTLNAIQSLLIFALETVSLYTSPYPVSRHEVVRLQLVLPVVSFLIFMNLPAGKKLFVITSLIFSIILTVIKAVLRYMHSFNEKQSAQAGEVTDTAVMAETK